MLSGDWNKAARMAATMVERFDRAKRLTLMRIGTYMERQLKRGMTDQAPGGQPYAPLHPFTIAARAKGRKSGGAGTKALLHHGDLRNSIAHQLADANTMFVGVLRGERRAPDGLDYASLAEIHEEGRLITITPRMRAWLHHNGLHLSPKTTHIVIPARPTFGPTFAAEEEAVLQIIADTMRKEMSRL